jgi:hypothetical protein
MKTVAKTSKSQPTQGKGPLPPTTKPKQGSHSSIGEDNSFVDETFGIDVTTTMWDHYPLVEVVWVDAVATATLEWSTIEEIMETQPASSRAVGYLLHTDQHRTILTALVNETDAAHAMIIPTRMVHTIRHLKATK